MRHVGNAFEQFLEFVIGGLGLIVQFGDFGLHGALLLLQGSGVGSGFAELADLGARVVGLCLKLLGFGDCGAADNVEFAEAVEVGRVAARRQALGNLFEIGSEVVEIVHDWVYLRW